MKHIAIYTFSGTGNTEYVSILLQKALTKHGHRVKAFKIEDILKQNDSPDLTGVDLLGICYPIHAFRSPENVERFAKSLPKVDHLPVFHIQTAGGISPMNRGASVGLTRILSKKGYHTMYDRMVAMGSNWTVTYDNSLIKALAETAKTKAEQIAADLTNNIPRKNQLTFVPRFLGAVVGFAESRLGAKRFGHSLHTTDACNSCMICEKNCPQQNIQKENNKLKFGTNCIYCMRCVYNCPKNAIRSSFLQFTILKDGYNLKKILLDKTISADFFDEDTRKSHARFYEYCQNKEA